MRLYLVQHEAAKTEVEDPHRGLNDEGRRTVEAMAEFLSSLRPPLDCIEHSEKLRARQTAEILAAHLQPAEGTRKVVGFAPKDEVEPMPGSCREGIEESDAGRASTLPEPFSGPIARAAR